MRPRRLEVEGFSAFRERVEVDFEDADLFAFTGPTGAGKSSLIDAMIFALYGNVPRYGHKGLVAPVINQGRAEARVRFDFTIGARPYTAARVVRRVKNGASVREARLESGEATLAGGADELTAEVERLLGLSFEQFTRCVVLPQGEFARFLHDRPAERQKLLSHLLGLQMYGRMRAVAEERRRVAATRAQLCQEQLAGGGEVDDRLLAAADKRVAALERLRQRIDRRWPEVERFEQRRREQAECAERAERQRAVAASIGVPEGIERVVADVAGARRELARARDEAGKADTEVKRARAARDALGSADRLREFRRLRAERAAEAEALAERRRSAGKTQVAAEEAEKALRAAEAELDQARVTLEQARDAHAAHALAGTLKAGEPCPVCRVPVARVPRRQRPPGLDAAQQRVKRAEGGRTQAASAQSAAHAEAAAAARAADELAERLDAIDRRLAGAPSAEEVDAGLAGIERAAAELQSAETARDAAQEALGAAGERAEREAALARQAWQAHDGLRDEVAELKPPAADRDDLAGSWRRLADWAAEQAGALAAERDEARREAERLAAKRDELRAKLVEACRKLELEVEGDGASPRDAVVAAHAEARAKARRIADELKRAADLREQADVARRETQVAGSLARHLRADGFERWLLDAAVESLLSRASLVLHDLSGGQYSFAHDDKHNFEVVDHRNADERRSVRTLSGGETFLASLALALTLVEEITRLAAGGAARLESIFLDEGFGTLDPDTLDVVASTIEELSTRDRAVGIVTHVRELADRIPVQYRVTKGPSTSEVERR